MLWSESFDFVEPFHIICNLFDSNNINRFGYKFNQVSKRCARSSLTSEATLRSLFCVVLFESYLALGSSQYEIFTAPPPIYSKYCDQRNYNRLIAIANIFYRNSDHHLIHELYFIFHQCFEYFTWFAVHAGAHPIKNIEFRNIYCVESKRIFNQKIVLSGF